MKKYFIFAASALALASCSSDDYLGNNPGNENGASSAINFGGGTGKTTRAAFATGDLQQNGFWVYGTKHTVAEAGDATNDAVVYQNYYLNYKAGSSSQSNTAGWEYVGVDNSKYKANVTPEGPDKQEIKYWDYSTKGYTFYAATAKPSDVEEGKVTFNKETTGTTVYDKGYTVTLKDGANIDQLSFADRQPVAHSNGTDRTAPNAYGGQVNFQFRNALSKVRVAMYETVPGYSVKINKFYYTDGENQKDATDKFTADATNTPLATSAEGVIYKVTYFNDTEANGQLKNQPKMLANATGEGSTKNVLELGGNLSNKTLAETKSAPTYDQAEGAYTWFMPQADNDKTLNLKVDYTLTSNDGSNEVINVKGATATIPAEYLRWRPNYAYTYIFCISDNTNGTTGGDDDPAGLYPITFNAVVVATEDGNVEYNSSLADATITTFAINNKNFVSGKDDYTAGSDLYATVVNKNKETVTLTDGNIKLYKITGANPTEALVANWIDSNKTENYTALTSGTNYSIVNSVPTEDGKTVNISAIKVASIDAGTYAIEYIGEKWTGEYTKIYKLVTIE